MLQHRKDFLIPLVTVISDVIAIEAAFLFSYWLRFYSPLTSTIPVTLGFPPLEAYVIGSLVVIPTWLFLFNSRNMYASRRITYFSDEFFAIVRLVFVGMLIVMAGAFFYRAFSYSRVVFAMLGFSAVFFISIERFIVMKFEQRWYARGHDLKEVIIVGTNATARRVYENISSHPFLGYHVVGYFSANGAHEMNDSGAKHLGSIDVVPVYIKEHTIDVVLIALSYKEHPQLYEMVRECEGLNTEMMMVPDMLEMMTSRVRIKELEGIPFINIKGVPLSTWNIILKRSFDAFVAVLVLILASPLFLLIAVLVKLDSKGPVFFLQERVGLDGVPFQVMKFRTMRTDAEKDTGPVWTTKSDPRTTNTGKFLRRFSLDEIPQLLNVLRGDMSIVGPRPERPHFVEQFKEIPKYLDRHRVKTGMTGWAQVNGLRGNAPIEERTKYDVYYVENWSLIFDLKIILKTIRAVLFGEDAY
ncbi:MAG: undecaprenyl-phosphate glucose phosphotransferase [Ignavibacteriales bacterium]|nr:undecaprenyl-phosphate glucose phosphotransferase [Ignavibacteriales bacterium]